jgi:hypothetical protein
MRSTSLRRLTGIWVAFLIAGITSGTVRAEMLWYVYAPGIGYVGKAGTTGWDNGILQSLRHWGIDEHSTLLCLCRNSNLALLYGDLPDPGSY